MKVIDNAALNEARNRNGCEMCGRRVWPLDPHHAFIKRGMGGGSRLDVDINLIGLCRVCHAKCESDRAVNFEAQAIIARREGTTIDEIQGRLWAMLRERA